MRLTTQKVASVVAVPLFGLLVQAQPAAAGGCGYYACGGEVVVVQPPPLPPPPVYAPCGCVSSGYAPAYGYVDYYYSEFGGGFYRPSFYALYGRYWPSYYGPYRAPW